VIARALLATAALAPAGCEAPPAAPVEGAAPFDEVARSARVAGDWRWSHDSTEDGVHRREREHWLLERDGLTRLRGSYLREVDLELAADDGLVFACNQRRRYRQVARFDVAGRVGHDGVELEEVGYQTAPSPCEPGLRRLGRYRARVDHDGHLVLVGEHSVARLTVGDGTPAPPLPVPSGDVDGAWTWSMGSWTADGLVQREVERWTLTRTGDRLAGGYQRVVTVVHPDGAIIPCAGADRWQHADRYTMVGEATDDGWRLREDEVEPGAHPCLAATPTRTLDAATAVLDGEYLVLTWRGPRKQVLARPALVEHGPWWR
jgi:hypothetical protein